MAAYHAVLHSGDDFTKHRSRIGQFSEGKRTKTETNHIAEIERHFQLARGRSVLLSPLREVLAFVARNAAALRTAGHNDLVASLEALDLETVHSDLELEQRLTEKMIAPLRLVASDEVLFEARRLLALDLKPYGKMAFQRRQG